MSIFKIIRNIFEERNERLLFLIRGCPGSGKTTLSIKLAGWRYPVIAADDYFMVGSEYKFNATKLHAAHKSCQNRTLAHIKKGTRKIFVNNTFTKARDMKPYYEMAVANGYTVFSIVVENRHGGKDTHNVPEETLMRMETELKNNLKLR